MGTVPWPKRALPYATASVKVQQLLYYLGALLIRYLLHKRNGRYHWSDIMQKQNLLQGMTLRSSHATFIAH